MNSATSILSISLLRFLELLPDAVFVSDIKGEAIFINPVAEKFLGLKLQDLKGKNVLEILPFAPQKYLAMEILNKLRTGGSVVEDLSFMTSSGNEFHGIFTCTAAVDDDGAINGVIAILKDNTARRHQEDMLYFLNKAGEELAGSLDYNETIRKIESLIVPRLADWFSIELANEKGDLELISIKHKDESMIRFALEIRKEYPTDRNAPSGIYQVLRTGQAELTTDIPDELLRKVAQDERHYEIINKIGLKSVMIVPMKLHGKVIGVISFISTKESGKQYSAKDLEVAEDFARKVAYAVMNAKLYDSVEKELTERRKTEELLDLAQSYGNMAAFSWDINTTGTWSKNLAALYGTKEGAAIEDIQQLVHPDDIKKLQEAMDLAYKTGDFYCEFRIIPPSGDVKWILARGKVLKENDVPSQLVGVNIDITRIKELEQKKDEFISIASHELKTPLTSVKAYIQLIDRMLNEQEQEKIGKYLNKTQGYIDKLSHLINDLLNVSKIQAGKLEFVMEEFDFDQLAKETIESIQHTVEHKLNYSGTTDAKVLGDKVRIEQVFFNLISNAVKYSPNAEQVDITIGRITDHIKVSVRDYGIGVSEQSMDRIFDRFYRAEHSANQFTGLGLGLFISSEIIKRHNGKLWVERADGGGSVFHFLLPLHG